MSSLNRRPDLSNVELDEAIRQALRQGLEELGAGEPPAVVWEELSRQVTAGPSRRRRQPPARQLSRLLAPLMQGLAATAVLLLLGLSLGPNLWVQSYRFGFRHQTVTAVPERTSAPTLVTESPTPLARVLARPRVEATNPQAFGPEPVIVETPEDSGGVVGVLDDDVLSTGVLRRYEEAPPAHNEALLLQANHPELDPVLTHLVAVQN